MRRDGDGFYKKLFALVLPMAFQNLMSALVSASDSLMLGFLAQDALSAAALAGQVQFVLNLFISALTIGETVLAAQYWGKGETDTVERVLAITMRFALLVSLVFFAAALCVPQLLMRIFTPDAALITLGADYLRAVSFSYLFTGFSQVYLCIMKNSGRTLRSTVYGSVAVVLNAGLNALLIFGLCGFPALGIVGAAVATSIARGAELLLVLFENLRRGVVRIRSAYVLKRMRVLTGDFLRCTAPVQANMLVWGCGLTMVSVIMGRLGSDAVAANALASVAKNIAACVCLGIGSGSSIIVGNALGSGALEKAKLYGRRLCHVSLFSGVLAGAVLVLCIPLVMLAAGSLTPAARGYLHGMLLICAYYLIGKAINGTVVGGIFCAGGDTRFGFLCDTVSLWCVVIPAGLLAAFVLKLPVLAVYFILNLDEFVKLPAVYRHYKKYKWVRDLTRKENGEAP